MEEHDWEGARKMAASNLVYEELLTQVQTLRTKLDGLRTAGAPRPQIVSCTLDLKNAISEAIVYANEAYLTQGAVHFSVIGQQIGGGIAKKKGRPVGLVLSGPEYLHSFREQVGDSIKVLNEHAGDEPWAAAYAAGKYLDRMVKSALPILPAPVLDLERWKNLGASAAELKGRGAPADVRKNVLAPLAKPFGPVSEMIENLRLFAITVEKSARVSLDAPEPTPAGKPDESPAPVPFGRAMLPRGRTLLKLMLDLNLQ